MYDSYACVYISHPVLPCLPISIDVSGQSSTPRATEVGSGAGPVGCPHRGYHE